MLASHYKQDSSLIARQPHHIIQATTSEGLAQSPC